ncbi:MAG: MATE family efflux transporter [Lachnospiraceae bacterium]|nr:MATE family efflux transporter [Lachnospiraceae bacterium]
MEKDFDSLPINKLIWKLGVPAMLAQLFNILYSIVDRIYIGHMRTNAKIALASIGICAPAFTAITGFASLIGVGGSALMSISIGEKNHKAAQQSLNNALILLAALSVTLTIILLCFKKPLLYLLGCSDAMYPTANAYFTIYSFGTAAVLCGTGLNRFIMGQGYARQGMFSIVLGAVINIAMDPFFIYVLNMGVVGAAIATVISQFCVLFYVLWVLSRKNMLIRLGLGQYSCRVCRKILRIGSMPFLIVVLDNMLIILLNAMLRKYGGVLGDQYISYAAVVQSVMVVAICPAEGLTNGCTTLFSYYYGSGNYKKILECFRGVLLYSGLYLGIITVVILFKPEWLVRLFLNDSAAIAQAVVFVQRYSLGFVFVSIQFAFVDGFTAMSMVKEAVPISFFRKGMYVISVLLLPMFFPLEYIFYASAISDCFGALFTLLLYFCCLKKRLAATMAQRTPAQIKL